MKKQAVLQHLNLDVMPKESNDNSGLCIVLVSRGSYEDYAIATDGNVIVDKQYVTPIKQILKYYPVPIKKENRVCSDSDAIDRVWDEAHEELIEWDIKNPANKAICDMNKDELFAFAKDNRGSLVSYVSENKLTPKGKITPHMSNADLISAILGI